MICTKAEIFDLMDFQLARLEYDLDARVITWASRAMESLFGYTVPGELEGKSADILVPEGSRDAHRAGLEAYAVSPVSRNISGRQTLMGRRKDGSTFPVSIGLYPGVVGPISNKKRVVIVIVFDLTNIQAGELYPVPAISPRPQVQDAK